MSLEERRSLIRSSERRPMFISAGNIRTKSHSGFALRKSPKKSGGLLPAISPVHLQRGNGKLPNNRKRHKKIQRKKIHEVKVNRKKKNGLSKTQLEIIRVKRQNLMKRGFRPLRETRTPPDASLLASLPGSLRDPRLANFRKNKKVVKPTSQLADYMSPRGYNRGPRTRALKKREWKKMKDRQRGNQSSDSFLSFRRLDTENGPFQIVQKGNALPKRKFRKGVRHRGGTSSLEGNNIFAKYYERGDIPCTVVHSGLRKVGWTRKIEDLDLNILLPVFFDGLRCSTEPCAFLAPKALDDILSHPGISKKILDAVPMLILPLKKAFLTDNKAVMVKTLKSMKKLIRIPGVGEALVPFFRQLLPQLNKYINTNENLGDEFDYKQDGSLADQIISTLQELELYGGDAAFANIKYIVPTYESCMSELI